MNDTKTAWAQEHSKKLECWDKINFLKNENAELNEKVMKLEKRVKKLQRKNFKLRDNISFFIGHGL